MSTPHMAGSPNVPVDETSGPRGWGEATEEAAHALAAYERAALEELVAEVALHARFGRNIPWDEKPSNELCVPNGVFVDRLRRYTESCFDLSQRAPRRPSASDSETPEPEAEAADADAILARVAAMADCACAKNKQLMQELDRLAIFNGATVPTINLPGVARSTGRNGFRPNVTKASEIHSKLLYLLNSWTGQVPGLVPRLRALVLARYADNRSTRGLADELRATAARAAAARAASGACPMLESFTTIDLFKPVLDELSARDAARFLRVLLGAGLNDPDIVTHLRSRFPYLHIYCASGHFPHRVDAAGLGHVYKDTQLGICVGIVENQPRELLRRQAALDRDARERDDAPELSPPRERALQRLINGDDAGFEPDEGTVRVRHGELGNPKAALRRVVRNGWRHVGVSVDRDYQRTTVALERVFKRIPVLRTELVFADTGMPVVPGHPHGGLEPSRWLVPLDGLGTLPDTTRLAIHASALARDPSRVPDNYPFPLDDLSATTNVGAYLRFWPVQLASEHQMRLFRIRVTATDRAGAGDAAVVLRAESAPMRFCATHRKRKA